MAHEWERCFAAATCQRALGCAMSLHGRSTVPSTWSELTSGPVMGADPRPQPCPTSPGCFNQIACPAQHKYWLPIFLRPSARPSSWTSLFPHALTRPAQEHFFGFCGDYPPSALLDPCLSSSAVREVVPIQDLTENSRPSLERSLLLIHRKLQFSIPFDCSSRIRTACAFAASETRSLESAQTIGLGFFPRQILVCSRTCSKPNRPNQSRFPVLCGFKPH
ncbi:hypothetical protein PV04_03824 [Phialophora macrospora]|uniref:Uncharacterized protein n=1 Tax=Phialophora macrospora TaxID=1851006 RepID=A0A0D2GHE6_9EURO|nr:hypothetical protein PV04_03824 [Phialophora macrospora]